MTRRSEICASVEATEPVYDDPMGTDLLHESAVEIARNAFGVADVVSMADETCEGGEVEN
jgi:hypothetical protein